MLNIIKKISNIILITIITCLFLCAAVLFVPRIFGYKPYIVLSGSMEPTIQTGSIAYINTKDTDVETGDIVSFYESNGAVVTHRIMRGDAETGYDTKGDANNAEDMNTLSQEQIIGTYAFCIPMVGYALANITSRTIQIGSYEFPSVIIMAVCITMGFFILSTVLDHLTDSEGED